MVMQYENKYVVTYESYDKVVRVFSLVDDFANGVGVFIRPKVFTEDQVVSWRYRNCGKSELVYFSNISEVEQFLKESIR